MSESETHGLIDRLKHASRHAETEYLNEVFGRAATRLESLQRENDALRRRLEALEVESLKAEEPE